MTAFEEALVVVGTQPTTYGEMRKYANETIDNVVADPVGFWNSMQANPKLALGALSGLCKIVLFLVDEVERLSSE